MEIDQFKARIAQIHRDLAAYTYYELLNLAPGASPDEIRAAFHRMAMTMHPDRYQASEDQELRTQLYDVYKRVTEGYRVLMKDETRRAYDEGLARGERRLVQTERARVGPKRVEDKIENPQAKKFFRLAQDAERRGDIKGARMNYKFALDLEPEHPLISAKMEALKSD